MQKNSFVLEMFKCMEKRVHTYWLVNKENAQEIIDTLGLEESSIQPFSISYTDEGRRMSILFGQVVVRNGIYFEVLNQSEFVERYINLE